MKNIDAHVRIGKVTSNRPPYDTFELTVTDAASGLVAFRASLTPEQFAQAITGGQVEVEATFNDSPNVGRRVEVATVHLDLQPDDWKDPDRTIQQIAHREFYALHPEMVRDGWRLDPVDSRLNVHRRTDKGYAVTARRYVDADPA